MLLGIKKMANKPIRHCFPHTRLPRAKNISTWDGNGNAQPLLVRVMRESFWKTIYITSNSTPKCMPLTLTHIHISIIVFVSKTQKLETTQIFFNIMDKLRIFIQ